MNIPITRRLLVAATLVITSAPGLSYAQSERVDNYPQRPIKLVVGIGAGSTTDLLTRIAARNLSEALKQPVVVENRPGAGGTLGAAAVATAPPDGYTLLFVSSSLPTFGHFYDNLKFDPVKDLVGAAGLAQGGMVMLTRPGAPWKNLAELVAYGKAKPDGTVSYASAGVGSIAYLYSELFAQNMGQKFLHVPYKSSAAALADLLAGHVDFVFDGTTTAKPMIDAGKVQALAYSSNRRNPFLPQVPTMQEAGVKDFDQRTWFGISAPRGTPQKILDRISKASATFTGQSAYRNELAGAAHEPMAMSAQAFERLVQDEARVWGKSIQQIRSNEK
ncbi:tripartite tricarboxylate transporter substrate binding protein [Ottowia thiooxydans]|uniref:Tripartite-type tricarboxylate transporter receptor subunit TctC n=1 Tax=Ottowia thiooxydans TaxID=219182 RepID=A0ABV2QD75_9BURK